MNIGTIGAIAWTFARRYRITLLLWVLLLIFGGLSYTTFLRREGFPTVDVPIAVVQGSYLVDDQQKVDSEIIVPITEAVETIDSIDSFQAAAYDNAFSVVIFFKEGSSAIEDAKEVDSTIQQLANLPESATVAVEPILPASFEGKYSMVLAVYENENSTYTDLQTKANLLAEQIVTLNEVDVAESIDVVEKITNPTTGNVVNRQTSVNRVGVREEGGQFTYYPAISVGLVAEDSVDDLALSDAVSHKLTHTDLGGAKAEISSDFAVSIRRQIKSLQSNLIGGLIAVLIVTLLLISWRAALVIALFIPTVLAGTFLGMNFLGFTLNTITLFAVILTLGLFVDDATIIVEALDAKRNERSSSHKTIITEALKRVGIASLAGTLTTMLVFAPILFVSGIIGTFIRVLPLTVILALAVSFLTSIIVVPLLSRILVLTDWHGVDILRRLSILVPIEKRLASFFGNLPTMPRKKRTRRWALHVCLALFSVLLVVASGVLAGKLSFDIFPQPKDGDSLQAVVQHPVGTTMEEAEKVVDELNQKISSIIADNLEYVSYQDSDNRSALLEISLTPFQERNTTSVQYVEKLTQDAGTIRGAAVKFSQVSSGPPTSDFPFQMRIYAIQDDVLNEASQAISSFIDGKQLNFAQNSTNVAEVKTDGGYSINRSERGKYITVLARFENTDLNSSATIELENVIQEEFTDDRLSAFGISTDDLDFDVSQESENADSFQSITYGLAIAIAAMYVILVLLFNSYLQPLLILIAVPFSMFGVFLGLNLTNNPMSFFVMMGFLGLVGIVVNNSILLTEYANQEKAAGADNRTAISRAVRDRFRPLIVTTSTTVFALLPLAQSDPFWQGLAYTIIFGMISSTTLIMISFPYYYLAVEWLRDKKNAIVPGLK